MHSPDHQSVLTMKFFALFLKCPLGDAAGSCPFSAVRAQRNLELKFRVAETMAARTSHGEDALAAHNACFEARLNRLRENRQAA